MFISHAAATSLVANHLALSRAKKLLALGLTGLLALLAGYALTAGRYDISLPQVAGQ